jgi:hypothetical protein
VRLADLTPRYPTTIASTATRLEPAASSPAVKCTPPVAVRATAGLVHNELAARIRRCPINLDNADPGDGQLHAAFPGESADAQLRTSLSEQIPAYVEEAIAADEFRSIRYYSLDREKIAREVVARLRELLPTAQLGSVAELRERAEDASTQKPTFLAALTLGTIALLLIVLLLLAGGVLSLLLDSTYLWAVGLFVLFAIAGSFASRRSQIIVREFNDARRASASSWRRYREAVIEQMINPTIREVINDQLYHYGSELSVQSSPGLMTDDPLFWIDTDNSRRLLNLMAVMPDGGSIGLAGPRGCGKTTLLRALCTGELRLRSGQAPEAVLVTAPVEFAPRDFLLHLFARVCQQSLRSVPPQHSKLLAGSSETAQDTRRRGLLRRHLGKVFLFGILCLIASPFVAYAALPVSRQHVVWHWLHKRLARFFGKDQHQVFADADQVWHFLHALDRQLAVIFAILFLVGLVPFLIVAKGLASLLVSAPSRPGSETEELARRHLQNIRFQQSYSYGWSGSLNVPIAQLGISEAVSLAEYQQSLPDIVASMREFLEAVATKANPVIITVDELDKVASDVTATQFLNDLKGIFGVRNCYYLVSVSEEALSNFELRGFPFRDAFDSAFDEVVHVRPLTYRESRRLLQRRVVGLSSGYLCLCQCLAGGLPRDLVRAARDLVETARRGGSGAPRQNRMCDVVATLVQLDMHSRAEATMIAIRRLSADLEIESMAAWIGQISNCLAGWGTARENHDSGTLTSELRAGELLELCGKYPAAVYNAKSTVGKAGGNQSAASAVSRLGLGLAGSLYYLATVIELFRDDRTKAEFQELDGSAASITKSRQIESLSRARQAFGVSPIIAWHQISDFRASWNMSVLDAPSG